jgi:hypothetical protein
MIIDQFIKDTLAREHSQLQGLITNLNENDIYWQPGPEANSIGWIVWHMLRVEDMWIQFFSQKQIEVWESGNWHIRFGLQKRETGFQHTPEQVNNFPHLPIELVLEYGEIVRNNTLDYLKHMQYEDFHVTPWSDKPSMWWHDFSILDMLNQLMGELYQHLGQIAYILGLKNGFEAVPPEYGTPRS